MFPLGTGPFRRSDAERGCTTGAIRAAVRSGRWVVLRRGILVTAEDRAQAALRPETLHAQDVQALLLALRRSHIAAAERSAARIYGLEFFRQPSPGLIVCTDDPGVSGTHKNDYFLRAAKLPEGHVGFRYGVPVTSPARTLLDLASSRSFAEGVVLAESAMRKGLLGVEELVAILAATEHRPGIEAARDALMFADPRTESVLESLSRVSMRQAGLVMPQTQQAVHVCDATYRVDFRWDHLPLDVYGEADGEDKYVRDLDRMGTVRAIRAEKAREQALRDTGAEVVRWGMTEARDPALLAARINGAFARAVERGRGRTG